MPPNLTYNIQPITTMTHLQMHGVVIECATCGNSVRVIEHADECRCCRQLKPGQKSIIADARAAGLKVDTFGWKVRIMRGRTTRSASVDLWEDGTNTRADVDLSLARNMSQSEVRKALQL